MIHSVNSLLLLLFACSNVEKGFAWLQQYGDPRSSNYHEFTGSHFSVGWNYTSDAWVSLESPAVTSAGIIFLPGRAYLTAINPNGTVLWKTGIAPNGNAYQTNVLFSESYKLVVIGTSWVDQYTFFMLAAVDIASGQVVWKSQQNDFYHATTLSISPYTEAVYVGGFDHQTFGAVHIKDGRLLWKRNFVLKLGIFMQTKVSADGERVLLPTDPWDGFEGKGRLIAYGTKWPLMEHWYADVGFDAGGLFACSDEVVFGSVGEGGGPYGQSIFAIDVHNGTVLWNFHSYCRSPQTSGPSVDGDGNVYYNCGNQVISLDKIGNLRWSSAEFGNATANSVTSLSIHPHGIVYFIHNNHTMMAALSTSSGRLIRSYSIENLGYLEPPILLGDSFVYLVGLFGNSVRIHSVEM
jgi:hypothetical protein